LIQTWDILTLRSPLRETWRDRLETKFSDIFPERNAHAEDDQIRHQRHPNTGDQQARVVVQALGQFLLVCIDMQHQPHRNGQRDKDDHVIGIHEFVGKSQVANGRD